MPMSPESLRSKARPLALGAVRGFFQLTHSSLTMLGLTVMFVALVLTARPDFRSLGEERLVAWLQSRQAVTTEPAVADDEAGLPELVQTSAQVASDASIRATAEDPKNLSRQQAQIALWLSAKYKVAPEPVSALVAEAFAVGRETKMDPMLILAVMAVESGFNPFAQSPVGAQGLMQVMTKVHRERYEEFGGKLTAFDPLTNLRVGASILQDYIKRAGSLEGGLRYYVGAANLNDDNGYAVKVLAEHARIQSVGGGLKVPFLAAPAPALLDAWRVRAESSSDKVAKAY